MTTNRLWSNLMILLFFNTLLSAQIVNIEDKRTSIADTIGWFGNIDMGFNLVKNTQSIITINGSGRIDFLHHRHSAFSLTNYSFAKAGDNQFVNQGFQHFRYNYQWTDRLVSEAFTQIQYNERIRVKLRILLGTGGRFQLSQEKSRRAYIGLAYMYEYEAIADTSIIHRNHRLSSYLSFNISPNSILSVSNTSYFQPVLHDFGNFRLTTATHFQIKVTKRLSLKSSFSLTYDSQLHEEVVGIPATIYSFLNGLSWAF